MGEHQLISDIEKEFYLAVYDEIKFIEISANEGQLLPCTDWLEAISSSERKRIDNEISK